ncbi:MAG TPA: glycosyltransferase, partial [Abditibacteriaceae bacterium]|nr:glycosyltransferase [Abditibacteriaceae bacterium]
MPTQNDVSDSIEYSNAAAPPGETAASSSIAASRPQTAAVIPAFNEAGRITSVLKVIAQAPLVDEIIVVTDGCDDSTADEARGFMARLARGEVQRKDKTVCRTQMRVFELEENIGKGGAMTYGALRTQADVLLFLDADLIGLLPEQVDALLEPAVRTNADERMDMVLGLFGAARGGLLGWWLSWCNRNVAAITGQRSIRRDVFLAVPDLTSSRYGVEAA